MILLRRTLLSCSVAMLLIVTQGLAQASDKDVLTNDGVIEMVVAKLPKEIILAKIASSRIAFDLSTTGLVRLHSNNVPKDILQAMMDAEAAKPPTRAEEESSGGERSAGAVPEEPGIYLERGASGDPLPLEPTLYTAGKTGGILGSQLTGGIIKTKLKAVVRGARANARVTPGQVSFLFVFDVRSRSLSQTSNWFGTVTSPNEFTLVRFDVKRSSREVVIASAGITGSQAGTEDKAIVPFRVTRLESGVYRVVVESLEPGEYAFFSAAAAGGEVGTAGARRLYDFGADM